MIKNCKKPEKPLEIAHITSYNNACKKNEFFGAGSMSYKLESFEIGGFREDSVKKAVHFTTFLRQIEILILKKVSDVCFCR